MKTIYTSMSNKIIVESIPDSLAAKVIADEHQLIVDEPLEYGGTDTGPDPYAYILSALGSCTVITLHMYAKRKKWPLKKVVVELRHEKNHIDDCKRCEDDDNAKLDHIDSSIYITGDLSGEQLNKLKIIAKKCPVHKTLEAGISIHTEAQFIQEYSKK